MSGGEVMNLHVEGWDLRMWGEAIMEGGEWTPDETMYINVMLYWNGDKEKVL